MITDKVSTPVAKKEKAINPLDGRIILAALWGAEILSSLNGDTYRLSDPAMMKAILENTGPITANPGLLTIMSILFVVPVFMSVLTLILKPSASLRLNRIIGIVYAAIVSFFFILNFVLSSASYEFIWSAAQLIFTLLVVWYAWKRPEQEA